MNDTFLISIVVPTKNRKEYALSTARQILAIDDQRIQLVIQDNSDNSDLKSALASIDDHRLKYNYNEKLLSFVDNFSQAVSLADGEYLCIIGDDDGINPEIIDIAEWASQNDVKAIKPSHNVIYYWPFALESDHDKMLSSGKLTIFKITSSIRVVDTINEVKKLMRNGCQSYLDLDLVKLYHGLVKKECMDEVLKLTGSYFGGLSPDIYSAVALSILIPKVVCIEYPLTISGICHKSGSADSATGRHTGQLKDAPHLKGHDSYVWSELVPPFYSVETIWADSALAAIVETDSNDLIKYFRTEPLSMLSYLRYKEHRATILDHYVAKSRGNGFAYALKMVSFYLNIGVILVDDFIMKVLKKAKRRYTSPIHFYEIRNIVDAYSVFFDYLHSSGIGISRIIKKLSGFEDKS